MFLCGFQVSQSREGLFHLKFVLWEFGKFYLVKIFRESSGKIRKIFSLI